ncbi:MAG: hypothetical protein NC408_01440 [Candidatus Gastranaerophilales bacterium]|nr:hypothetical protein [Candidatus Gastranaerophilales bacterium]MCM1072218.1 hypothetical protein [Bacteroides sp.]
MNLSIMPVNTPQFQGRQLKVKYNDIKNIPNVPCACCGKKVIIPEQLAKIFAAISRPLASVLKAGELDNWDRKKGIWNVLKNLAQMNPKKSLTGFMQEPASYIQLQEAILEAAKEKCAARPDKLEKTRRNMFSNILNDSKANLRSSSVVMRRLAPLKSYLDGTKLETFEQLEIYSRKYPRKSLSEIVQLEEVYKFHEIKNSFQRLETEEQINFHFENIQKIMSRAISEPQEFFDNLRDEAMDIYASNPDAQIRMAKIKEHYQRVLEEHNCEKLKNKVNKEIDQIPPTFTTKDSFFVAAHNHNYDDNKILTSIFNPVMSTFEHVIPRSKDGKDKMKNGLVMHKDCNRFRGNMPYEDFFEYHSDMPRNIQKQINFIARQIINGTLSGRFRFWPMSIAKTLFFHTHGAIDLDLTKHCKQGLEDTEKRIEEREGNIAKLKRDRDGKIRQKEELRKQIEAIESELDGIGDSVKELVEENQDEKKLLDSYESHIKIRQRAKAKQGSKSQNK